MNLKYFLCLLCVALFIQCDNSADKYYERPYWLEQPIYEVLQAEGRFTKYLQCVDKTDYAHVLKGAGLYTVFAPNDEAFSAFLNEKNYSSVDAIPQDAINDLVSYSIVYSKWFSEHLSDYLENGVYAVGAFKRKTTNYALPYQDSEYNTNWVFDETVPGGISVIVSNYEYRLGDNNYKYVPLFTDAYFSSYSQALTAADYNTFFPNSTYTGKNVQGGRIVTADIIAENGIIHEISVVNEPLDNMDDILKEPNYSGFKTLIDMKDNTNQYLFKSYSEASASHVEMFQTMMPSSDINTVYVKSYNSLAFSPLLENIYTDGVLNTERNGNTLFVPSNTALQSYIDNKLLKYYGSVDKLPKEVIQTLINTHMVNGLVWPSQYSMSINYTGEYLNGVGSTGSSFEDAGVIEKRIASNGFVYLTNNVVKSKYFETVYSEIYLNPAHEWLNQAYSNYYSSSVREELMHSVLDGYTSERYTMLNFSDDLLKADGYGINSTTSPPSFTNAEMSNGVDDRLKRLMKMHIFPGLVNSEVNSEIKGFSTAPISNYGGWGFLVNYYGDVIRYKNNQLQAAGNIEDGTYVNVTEVEGDFNNGKVFNVDRLLQYSPRETTTADARWTELTMWTYLSRAKEQNPNVSMFVDYVEACLKSVDSNDLDGIKAENFYTVLMVNNTAMNQAVTRGYLPALTKITVDGDLDARATATKFLNAHFLQGTVLPDDGLSYIYPVNAMSPNRALVSTLLKITDESLGITNSSTRIEVIKAGGLLIFTPQDITQGTQILVAGGFGLTNNFRVQRGAVTGTSIPNNYRSNRIACKAILHEVNNFFTFTVKGN